MTKPENIISEIQFHLLPQDKNIKLTDWTDEFISAQKISHLRQLITKARSSGLENNSFVQRAERLVTGKGEMVEKFFEKNPLYKSGISSSRKI